MKLDLDKPVQTRDGRSVRILATDRDDATWPVVALISSDGFGEGIECYTADGKDYPDGRISNNDLINVPVTTIRFINLYGTEAIPTRVIDGFYSQKEAEQSRYDVLGATTCKVTSIDSVVQSVEIVSRSTET